MPLYQIIRFLLPALSVGIATWLCAQLIDACVQIAFAGLPSTDLAKVMQASIGSLGVIGILLVLFRWACNTFGRVAPAEPRQPLELLHKEGHKKTDGSSKINAIVIRVYFSGGLMATWVGQEEDSSKDFLARVQRAAGSADEPLTVITDDKTYKIPGRSLSHWIVSREEAWVPNGSTVSFDLTRDGPDERIYKKNS